MLNLEVETTESLTAIAGHVCVPYRGSLICWGGYCYDEHEINYRESNSIYIFPYKLCGGRDNVWFKIRCNSDLNLRPNSGATAGIHRDQLYIFGGCLFDDVNRRMVNTSKMIVIDLRTGLMRAATYARDKFIPTPRDKATSWVANEKFFIFGGYGMSWHRLNHANHLYFSQPECFLDDDIGSCWNNQLLYYDFNGEEWHEVKQHGKRPSQRAAAASTLVSELNLVFLFGGRHDLTRLNDLYVLDLKTFIWTQINFPISPSPTVPASKFDTRPQLSLEGRSWCTFTLLDKEKKILCYGGLSSRGEPLNELWHLDIHEFYWAHERGASSENCRVQWQLIDPCNHELPPRLWHCTALIDNEAILVYGGMNEPPSRDSPFVNTLIVHQIQTPTLRHLTLSEYADQIIDAWLAALMAKGKKFHSSHLHYLSKRHINKTEQRLMDLHTFADDAGFFALLPRTLQTRLRALLSIRKRSKTLNRSDTLMEMDNSPSSTRNKKSEWKNHEKCQLWDRLVNYTIDENREIGGGNCAATTTYRQLSPHCRKRALAEEICKYVCENAATYATPRSFLASLFDLVDL